MRALSFQFLTSASVAYVAFSLVGLAVTPGGESAPLGSDAAAEALAFAFPNASASSEAWAEATGRVSHGWLLRRAYIEGTLVSDAPVRHSEQILKVGWPFTVVRGFVRTSGAEMQTEGARIIGPASSPVRVLPLQPVWPGVVLMGLMGTMLLTLTAQARHRRSEAMRTAA
ncbi:MAG: hypothetical protein AAF170_02125 [Bacteroidota bacterium]